MPPPRRAEDGHSSGLVRRIPPGSARPQPGGQVDGGAKTSRCGVTRPRRGSHPDASAPSGYRQGGDDVGAMKVGGCAGSVPDRLDHPRPSEVMTSGCSRSPPSMWVSAALLCPVALVRRRCRRSPGSNEQVRSGRCPPCPGRHLSIGAPQDGGHVAAPRKSAGAGAPEAVVRSRGHQPCGSVISPRRSLRSVTKVSTPTGGSRSMV